VARDATKEFFMFSLRKRFAATLAAIVIFAMASATFADSTAIKFHTSGAFTNNQPAGAVASGSSLVVANTTLTYNAASWDILESQLVNGTVTDTSLFGSFSISSTDPNGVLTDPIARSYTGAHFVLTVTQDFPVVSPNTGTFQSLSISGELRYREPSGLSTEGGLFVVFDQPLQFTIPPGGGTGAVTYKINQDVVVGKLNGALPSQEFGVGGSASVPLPGVALGGLWLLGGIGSFGGVKTLQRRRSSMPA